jgi:hypothetical protein
MPDHNALICPQCLIGMMKSKNVTYTGVLEGLFVSVPNIDALICDVCGCREYPPHALLPLEALFGELPLPTDDERPTAKWQTADELLLDRLRGHRPKP